jgi:hypothetical protein
MLSAEILKINSTEETTPSSSRHRIVRGFGSQANEAVKAIVTANVAVIATNTTSTYTDFVTVPFHLYYEPIRVFRELVNASPYRRTGSE